MSKEELEKLFLTDDDYKKVITECDEWIKGFITETPDNKKASSCAKYLENVIGLVISMEEVLTGNYSEDSVEEFGPKKGEDFNLDSIEFMQTTLFSTNYRISLMHRETQKVINKWMDFSKEQSPFLEVLDTIIHNGHSDIFTRGYVPQYVYDLEMDTSMPEEK